MATSSSVRPHVPEDELHAYCDGELSPTQRVEIAEHLLGCLICRAQHAEVDELRTRTSLLLAVAAPRTIRRPALTPQIAPVAGRRRMPRLTAAAAIALLGAGVWFSLQNEATRHPAAQAAAIGATPSLVAAASLAESDPAITAGWTPVAASQAGAIAHVRDLTIARVRMAPATTSGSLTMVRQLLADEQPVWVFAGPTQDLAKAAAELRSAGLSTSTNMGTIVAGKLSADSLNALQLKTR